MYRPGYIDSMTQALRDQTFKDFEWIIIDDLWKQRKDIVREYVGDSLNLKHIPPREINPFSQTSMAFNTALIHAEGELVHIMNDYMYLHPKVLERHWQIYSKYGPNVMISGPLLDAIVVSGKSVCSGAPPMPLQIKNDEGNIVIYLEPTPPIPWPLKDNFEVPTPENLISIWKKPFEPTWPETFPPDWRMGAISKIQIEENLYENDSGKWFWARNDSVDLEVLLNVNGMNEAFDGRRGAADGELTSKMWRQGCRSLVDREAPCYMLPHPVRKRAVISEQERNRRIRERNGIPDAYNLREERRKILAKTFDTSITVAHAGRAIELLKCVASIKENTVMPYQLVIVIDKPDNAAREYLASLDAKVAINPELVGAEPAANQALQMADGKYLCIVNTDVQLSPAAIESMREALRIHSEFGWVALSCEHTGFFVGCSMITREAFNKVGLFDTQFSTAFSDDDYMRRVWKAGYKPHIIDGIKVSHKEPSKGTIAAIGKEEKARRFKVAQALFHEKYGEWGTNWDAFPKYQLKNRMDIRSKVTVGKQVKNLNIGSFTVMLPPPWINLDIIDLSAYAKEHGFNFQRADVTKGLPYEDNSVNFINASHLIEHLTDGIAFLKECWRVLKPNSTIRIGTPDVNKLIDAYKNKEMDKFNDIQPEEYKRAPSQADKFWRLLTAGHKTCYDLPALEHSLELANFESIQQSKYNKELDKFPEVSLYVGAKKPAYVAEKMPAPQREGIPEYWQRFASEKRIGS